MLHKKYWDKECWLQKLNKVYVWWVKELFWSTLFRILEWAIGLKVAECYNCYWWILGGGEKGLVLLAGVNRY